MTRTDANQAFTTADAEWSLELVREFGREAGQARWEPRGRGRPGEKLHTLWLARDNARRVWEQARVAT